MLDVLVNIIHSDAMAVPVNCTPTTNLWGWMGQPCLRVLQGHMLVGWTVLGQFNERGEECYYDRGSMDRTSIILEKTFNSNRVFDFWNVDVPTARACVFGTRTIRYCYTVLLYS